jgi:hypothetical protein
MCDQGQDAKSFILSKLEDVKSRLSPVTSDNLSEACTWLLQLSYDCGELREHNEESLDVHQIESELGRLITLTMSKWSEYQRREQPS